MILFSANVMVFADQPRTTADKHILTMKNQTVLSEIAESMVDLPGGEYIMGDSSEDAFETDKTPP